MNTHISTADEPMFTCPSSLRYRMLVRNLTAHAMAAAVGPLSDAFNSRLAQTYCTYCNHSYKRVVSVRGVE